MIVPAELKMLTQSMGDFVEPFISAIVSGQQAPTGATLRVSAGESNSI